MPLILEVISKQRDDESVSSRAEFGPEGGTIGRSAGCSWILPDTERFVSSRHASIDYRAGSYYLIDTSTNGTYINGAHTPVGQGSPQRLFDGDLVRLGDYEISVHIRDDESMSQALRPRTASGLDTARVAAMGPTEKLLDERELAVEEMADRLLLEGEAQGPSEQPPARPRRRPSRRVLKAYSPNSTQPVSTTGRSPRLEDKSPSGRQVARSERAAVEAFLRSAGLNPTDFPDVELHGLLRDLGQIMRELVVGLSEVLHNRAAQKTDLRMPKTMIQSADNNPLKFAVSVNEALQKLLWSGGPEYLRPLDAVRETFHDIKTHQLAVMLAMESAVKTLVSQLEPGELERRFEQRDKRRSLTAAGQRAHNWQKYDEFYKVLTHTGNGALPAAFMDEFTRAYEQVLEKEGPAPRRAGTV